VNGVAAILASLEEARGTSLYDEWRCVEALVDLGAASAEHHQDLIRLRREVAQGLGIVLEPA
jgi:hypothetical protein